MQPTPTRKPGLILRMTDRAYARRGAEARSAAGLLADPRARVPRERLGRLAVLRVAPLLRRLLHARPAGVLGLARAEALGVHGVHLVALAAVLDRAVARVLDVVAGPGRELRRAAVVAADLHERRVGGRQLLAARALHEQRRGGDQDDDAEEDGPGEKTPHAFLIGRTGRRR